MTLLGDAAHLAPPDGECAELGKAIANHPGDFAGALHEYEEGMFARSATADIEAVKTFKLCFQDDSVPYGLMDFLRGGSTPA